MDDDNGKGASKNEQFGEGWERDPNRINPHLQVKNYCENFSQGSTETHQVLIGEDTVPFGNS